ncbi:MAG: ribosome silencing factor [Cytophagales bacterium]|nr:MAG: ribosome silencing factor [Cytophagales bacterium]TAF62561.1 MAG: ribosome silencing factor [Cytophagales bacterium]
MTSTKITSAEELNMLAIKGLLEKKAQDIVLLDLRNVKKSVADFFIIATGTSSNHVDTVALSVEAEVFKASGELPWHLEGRENKEWILIDYVSLVVHVFQKSRRDYYELETLWGDAVVTRIASDGQAPGQAKH